MSERDEAPRGGMGQYFKKTLPSWMGALIYLSLTTLNLKASGWGRLYLSGAARSMSLNWSNWFFASYDPLGSLTVEKPPLPLWIQSLMVKMFGMRPVSILLPSAVLGSVLIWVVVKRLSNTYGSLIAGVGGILLATMPGLVALGRTNNADIYTIFFGAMAFIVVTGETKRREMVAGVLLGAAFLSKGMFMAFPMVACFTYVFLINIKTGYLISIKKTTIFLTTWVLSWVWWPLIVMYSDPNNRPYVAHTNNNNPFEQFFGWGSINGPKWPESNPEGFGGPIGIGRIFYGGGDQLYWILSLSLLGGILLYRKKLREVKIQTISLYLWLVGFTLVYCFTDRVVHEYYVAMGAVPALFLAMGVIEKAILERGGVYWRVGVLGVLGMSFVYMRDHAWLLSLFLVIVIGAYLVERGGFDKLRAVGVLFVMVGSLSWGVSGVFTQPNDWNPVARPFEKWPRNEDLIPQKYYETAASSLRAGSYLMMVPSYGYAEEAVLRGKPVLPAGGFNGGEQKSMSAEKLSSLVKNQKLRFVLRSKIHSYNKETTQWIEKNCREVHQDETTSLVDCQ